MAITLKPLMQFGLRQVMVTTMQVLAAQVTQACLSLDIIDNVVPFISGEEEKWRQNP